MVRGKLFSKSIFVLVMMFSMVFSGMAADAVKLLLNRDETLKAAAKVDLKSYPDGDVVLVSDYEQVRYNPDGTSVTIDEEYEKVLTEKGKRDSRAMELHFTLPYETVKVLLLEIVKPDGKIIPIDIAKNSKEMISSGQMSSNIYDPNSKILSVAVPGLEIGDMVHMITRRDGVKSRIRDTWCDFFVLQADKPIVKYIVEVNAPASKPLKKILIKDEIKGAITFTENKIDDRILYKWEARNIPMIFMEPDMPPYYMYVQRLLVSTVADWKEISQWYWNLSKPHLDKVTPGMRQEVEALTKGLKTQAEKINAIFQFVSKKIRYMGITSETEAPGYEPHDVDITFNNRYGVCRDKAALLTAMLRLAGINAYPVLFYVGPKKDAEVPNNYFNHAICSVDAGDGKYILMDPTDETTTRLLPSYLCDKSYLVAKPDGDDLKTSPVIPAVENMAKVKTTGGIDRDGALSATTVIDFQGINDGVYRGAFSRWEPDYLRQFFASKIKVAVPGAVLGELKIHPEDLRDMSKPLQVELKFKVADFLINGGENVCFSPPWLSADLGVVNFVLQATGLEKRKFPLQIFSTCGTSEEFKLKLPPGYQVAALPGYSPVKTGTLDWIRNISASSNEVGGRSEFLINTLEFSPPEYLKLKQTLKKIEFEQRKMLVLKKDFADVKQLALLFPAADTVTINKEMTFELKRPGEWASVEKTSKKILTYGGLKKNSELKIHYNPAWEKVEIKAVAVVSPDGKISKLAANEVNIMDAGWVGSAPRYPAEKIMVVSLPGVTIGSELQYTIRKEFTQRSFFSVTGVFREADPILSKTIKIISRDLKDLKVSKTAQNIKLPVENGIGWRVKNCSAVPNEPGTPPIWTFVPSVFVSNGDWAQYGAEINKAFMQAALNQPQAVKMGKKLTDGVVEPRKKLRIIRDFVAENIRPAGPGLNELPLALMTAADVTLAERYGNSVDRAILLYALLSGAGLESEPVAVSSQAAIKELEQPLKNYPQQVFDGILVRVKPGDRIVYLNDTSQYAEPGAVNHEDRCGLELTSGKIFKIEAQKDLQTGSEITSRIKVDGNGAAVIAVLNQYYGREFESRNRMFAEMTPEELKRYFQKTVSDIAQSAVATGALQTDFKHYPGKESFEVTIPDFAVKEAGFLYFKLPGSFLANLLHTGADGRKNPFLQNGLTKVRMNYQIELPDCPLEVKLMPESYCWQYPGDGGEVKVEVTRQGRQLNVTGEVDFKPAFVSPDEYLSIINAQAKLSSPKMGLILVALLKK